MGGGIISTWQSILNGFDFSYLLQLLLGVIPALICITIHEFCHGLTAFYLGDDTAKRMGRLSLNPIRHLDPVGFLMLVIFRFGWAKPVPVRFSALKDTKHDMGLVALAGPIMNFLLAFLTVFIIYGIQKIGQNNLLLQWLFDTIPCS